MILCHVSTVQLQNSGFVLVSLVVSGVCSFLHRRQNCTFSSSGTIENGVALSVSKAPIELMWHVDVCMAQDFLVFVAFSTSSETMAGLDLSPSANDAIGTLQELGRASGMLSKTDSTQVALYCEASKEVLLGRAQAMVASSAGLPVLSSKSCDGTPIRVQHHASLKLPSGKKAKTIGKRGVEILVSNEFIRFQDPSEGWKTSCIVSEPVPLTKGKSVDLVTAAARQTWQSLRSLGAKGLTVEHYVWDRAGIEALERHARAWHAAQPEFVHEKYGAECCKHMEMLVVTPCALHDSQNGFRWAFLQQCKDRTLMRDLYIATASLRNSADLFSTRIATWIGQSLTFVETRGSVWREEMRELWMALDVAPDLVEILVADLELHWDGTNLCVMSGAKVSVYFC